jgi:hypothetical protein
MGAGTGRVEARETLPEGLLSTLPKLVANGVGNARAEHIRDPAPSSRSAGSLLKIPAVLSGLTHTKSRNYIRAKPIARSQQIGSDRVPNPYRGESSDATTPEAGPLWEEEAHHDPVQ